MASALEDRTSLTGSIGDFSDSDKQQSPLFGLPSQHSGFRASLPSDPEVEEEAMDDIASDDSPWSPPAWRQPSNPGGWYRHQPYTRNAQRFGSHSASRSRNSSHGLGADIDDPDATLAAKIPLPRGSTSPSRNTPARSSVPHERLKATKSLSPELQKGEDETGADEQDVLTPEASPNNFIRFALRAEVQQRTEPLEAAVSWLRKYYAYTLRSWGTVALNILMIFSAVATLRFLFREPSVPPSPDLVKVATLARSFEPLVYYSQSGAQHVGDLQETGVAVWDLCESIRTSNMTSTSLIVTGLDDLSESLKGLSIEMIKFFTNVDGDIDSIILVMDWAKLELAALRTFSTNSFSHAVANVHSVLSSVGVFEDHSTGLPTSLGKLFTVVFGVTGPQRTQQTLQRTFHEFLNTLEDCINKELTSSVHLFALFETIDRQFVNLQRTVTREFDTQERLENEFLSSLWTRMVGANRQALHKYDKNKKLLASIRSRTVQNKGILLDHNGKLRALKGNLENLRNKLMSPLVSKSGIDFGLLGVEEQIRGLQATYDYLKRPREMQKQKILGTLYGASARRQVTEGDRAGSVEG